MANILITTLLMNDLISYRRYYDVLTNLIANKENKELSTYMSLLELTRQYKIGEVSAELYQNKVTALIPHLDADTEEELALIKTIAPMGFAPKLQTFLITWPANLGFKWCGKYPQ